MAFSSSSSYLLMALLVLQMELEVLGRKGEKKWWEKKERGGAGTDFSLAEAVSSLIQTWGAP